ncbi:type II secretion system protein GspL [Legionella fallonii]|uniref:Type II secretion system protein L n=1 Tax=Legionella fallonii LLAP-10 TaxID=1212491 RepID=A0A098G628_9GAMM|nr:type II secretion system protein GspL [Legionella fallonii]CEG57424.1 Type II secretion system protein L [Legionella fallonii LLAP-10]
MDHCFLFAKHLNDNGCLCLKISSDGTLIAPPEQRSFAEIKSLQNECSTTIVETTANATLLDLELPWLPERKARIAIPYALEDKVAQPVEELHFAFDKLRYQQNHYMIVAIDKHRIQYLMQLFVEQGIEFAELTLDWFALSLHELCVNESVLLINNDDFKGALSGDLATSYIKKNSLLTPPLVFEDSHILLESSLTKNEGTSYHWIAQKLLKTKPMNLCQGEMLHGNTFGWITKGYQLVGGLCVIWLLSILIVNAISLHSLNRKTTDVDQQIAMIYREFFPDAKQVISPKFRISQLLGSSAANSQSNFWHLLNQFAQGMDGSSQITVEELRYQSRTLSVTLTSSDFAHLEQIENKLKKLQLKVKQTQASTRDQHVFATLELT